MSRTTSDRPTTIYTLSAGPAHSPRYVGKTVARIEKRLSNHVGDARRNARWPVQKWVRSLLDSGCEPCIEVLEIVEPGEDWAEAERHWIAVLRGYGCDLLNLSPGGEGTTGYRYTLDQRQRLRDAHQGQQRTAETVEKWRATMERKRAAGWRKSAAPPTAQGKRIATMRERRAAGLFKPRRKATPEERRRASEVRRASDSPEYRARISEGRRGKGRGPRTPEHCAAISEAKKRANAIRRAARVAA